MKQTQYAEVLPAEPDYRDVKEIIRDSLTLDQEDWGIGAYEYHGATGTHTDMVWRIQEGVVYLDATRVYARLHPIAWILRWFRHEEVDDLNLPDEVEGSVRTDDGEYVRFKATLAGPATWEGKDKLVQAYEIEHA